MTLETIATCRRCGGDFEGLILDDSSLICTDCAYLEKLERYEEERRGDA
jgi:hypothetical protein